MARSYEIVPQGIREEHLDIDGLIADLARRSQLGRIGSRALRSANVAAIFAITGPGAGSRRWSTWSTGWTSRVLEVMNNSSALWSTEMATSV